MTYFMTWFWEEYILGEINILFWVDLTDALQLKAQA
jgi:hypothetical protein